MIKLVSIKPVVWRFSLLVLLVLGSGTLGWSQNPDSIHFANTHWTKERIAAGVRLYHHSFAKGTLFGTTENINFIKIKSGFFRKAKFALMAEAKTLRPTSDFMANNRKAIAAINGNFFDMKNGGAVDFIKVDGEVVNINRKNKNEKPDFHQKAAIVIDNGKLDIVKWDGLVNWEEWLKQPNIMLNGPLILKDNQRELLDSSSFNKNRHPRTAVGITKDGAVILLVVDGRHANSAGMSLFELTKVMQWLGCVQAINFDGGGSSTLWMKNKGVINHPSDNKKWDHQGERKVANVLYIRKGK
ncbi:MAG TPA: phosphodiester glycosidase family protein [Niabella sp.]|nr:phosphodiester glycosidase family protein [Niabella sp.]HOZ97323.1 phosphodiester glycosidase family protein [Niabella sp.]HQW15406.1 phosphodiester glycosidase family protein [Niabella sp.]HQX20548.1 phosphodiester glycosidase family protein [Niabella sp.]HQX41081.1 phosphodiester glycosidase family protein [Niabella sp.]